METVEQFINKHRCSKEKSLDFVSYLYELMDKHGYNKNSDLYKKANIDRQYWSLIISGKRKPSLQTVIKIVFALELDNHECKYLLKKAGYTLASSSEYSLIIRYFVENKIYDLDRLNEHLLKYGYKDLLIY